MKTNFDLMKNGKVATTVWANKETKEIYEANRNSFGYNAECKNCDWFFEKYGCDLKTSRGVANRFKFYYSAAQMESAGFQLVKRGDNPLWNLP